MASADYSVGTKVTADVSNFEKGMNKAEKSLKGFSDKLANSIDRLGKKGLIGSMANVTLAVGGLTKSLSTVIKFAKDVGKAINECTEAYKGQIIAERALDTAIQNNPFISGSSSKALKEFASEMQKVSNYGDEELIPMMTNLVSLGRTESETMQIMSVAMDMSAGMGISLDSAITQLNATLNGNIGRLGQQNAELKGLTEEELKQGKAVEILGEKFKGLSSATADTSKQLKNIKGDFKEALGQFTLPSSDMWNKFWAGFYERGIEVLRKLDDYLDINTVGKKIFENIQDEAKKIAKSKKLKIGDVLGDFNFISEQLSGLSEKELSVLKKSLEGIKDRTDIEQYWLNMVSKRLHNIELEADQERANAEAEARRAKAEEERLAKEKELEELRKKQAEERAKALAVQDDWENKLFAIRIENLEKIRDKELDNEKLTQEQKIEINEFYGDQILAMKIKQIEKERDAILSDDKLTEESRVAIGLYYENKITQVKGEEEEKRLKLKKKEIKEEEKEGKKNFLALVKMAQDATKKIAETFKNVAKKIASTVKNVISGIGNIFTKLFEFNPDEALDNLLEFEDSVLTFFVETLPKLPQFFESAFSSIAVLVKSVMNIIDFDSIADTVGFIANGLLDIITNVAGVINNNSDKITKGFVKIVKTIIEGIANWISSGGWKELLNLLLTIQMALEEAITENIDEFAETIGKMLPDLVNTLIKSIVSASRTLGKIAKSLLPLIAKIIKAIIKVITSDEVVQASIEAVEGLVEGLIPAIVEILVNALPRIINFFLVKLPSYTPQLIVGIINGLVNAISNMDFAEIVVAFFDGFTDAFTNFGDTKGLGEGIKKLFKKLFSFDFWIDSFANITEALVELIKEAFTSINFTSLLTSGGSSGGSSGGGSWWQNALDPLGWFHKDGTNATHRGLALVGEAGPELVRFNGGEQVLNNRNTNKALAEMGQKTNNFNVTFNNMKDTSAFAMVNQLKQYNRQMAINGIL